MISGPRGNVGQAVLILPFENSYLGAPANLLVLVSVDEPYEGQVRISWLEDVTRCGLAAAGVSGTAEVSLLITDDETVRSLNAEYRGLDETTDVLSFSSEHAGHWEGEEEQPARPDDFMDFILPSGTPQPLGEIIISWPQAQRQAEEQGNSPMSELAHLIVHGALHLVGHDHVEPEEAERMQALERKALETLQSAGSAQP